MLKESERWAPGADGWADEPLWVIQRFINTIELNDDRPGEEELTGPDVLREFLVKYAGLERDAPVRARDLERARELREALRALLVAKTEGETPDPASVAIVNHAIEQAKLAPSVGNDCCSTLGPRARGVTGAFGRILAPMLEATGREEWDRMKACGRDSCRWAFYDRSKNRSRNWCSMQVCGNREKVAAFRARQVQ